MGKSAGHPACCDFAQHRICRCGLLEELTMNLPLLYSLLRFDRSRHSMPGEHLATLGMGVSMLMSARKRSSRWAQVASMLAGAALIYRAASGRDGIRRVLRRRGSSGFLKTQTGSAVQGHTHAGSQPTRTP
jgi:hypothetical protein